MVEPSINPGGVQHDAGCIYCGNPNPERAMVTQRESGWSLFWKLLEYKSAKIKTISGPQNLSCQMCGRKYQLISDLNNVQSMDILIKKIRFAETAISSLQSSGIHSLDISSSIVGCAMPLSPKEIKGDVHIIFNMGGKRRYIRCKRVKDSREGLILMAIGLGVI